MALRDKPVELPPPNPNYPGGTSSGLVTGTVKYYREPRKRARVFKPCDVARIARTCLADNQDVTAEQLLAVVAKGLGFTHIALQSRVEERQIAEQSKLVTQLEKIRDALDSFLRGLGLDV